MNEPEEPMRSGLVDVLFFGMESTAAATANLHLGTSASMNAVRLSLQNSALLDAVTRGDYDNVVMLLEYGVNANAQTADGRTVLDIAVNEGWDDIVIALVSHGANVSLCCLRGRSPLLTRVGKLQASTIELIIEKGADVNAKDKNGVTPLMTAAANNKLDTVEVLVSHGANINTTRMSHFRDTRITALCFAAKNGREDIVDFLMAHGADIEARDEYGATGLILAAKKFDVKMVEILIRHGADIEATDKHGNTALLATAAQVTPLSTRIFFLGYHGGMRQLTKEAWHGLVTASMNIDPASTVHHARRRMEISRLAETHTEYPFGAIPLLIAKGANVNAQRHDGATPLILASQRGDLDVVKLLLSNGTNVEVENKMGMTALRAACTNGHSTIVQELVQHHVGRLNHYSDVPYWLVGEKASRF